MEKVFALLLSVMMLLACAGCVTEGAEVEDTTVEVEEVVEEATEELVEDASAEPSGEASDEPSAEMAEDATEEPDAETM